MNIWKNIIDKKTLTVDIGSKYIRACVFSESKTLKKYKVLSSGVEYGLITNKKNFESSLKIILEAVVSDFKIIPKNVLVTISTIHQNSASLSVITYTKRADGIITDLDIAGIKNNARKKIEHLKDNIILHEIIIKNKVDGVIVVGELRNAKGAKIESKILFIYDDMYNYKLLSSVFESFGIEIDQVLSGPFIEAESLLSEKEKRLGTAVLNMGHHVSSLCVYERGAPLLSSCINYGGEDITSKIALGLRVDIDIAESIKIDNNLKDYSKRKCEEIVENSLYTFAENINTELARIKRSELLPGGLRLIGGSSGLYKIENYLKYALKLPVTNINTDERYSDIKNDAEYIKNYNSSQYSENITEMHIYKKTIKNSYLKIESLLKKFLP